MMSAIAFGQMFLGLVVGYFSKTGGIVIAVIGAMILIRTMSPRDGDDR
jgi:hypothetical protein